MAAYALVMRLDAEVSVPTGTLGIPRYPAGYYVYVGSAVRGMFARVSRHMRPEKRLRWHVDYLAQRAQVVAVLCDAGVGANECEWARLLGQVDGASVFPRGFGSSDCRCPGHLVHFSERPSFAKLVGALYA